ncbi:hypothetical protein BpHYR1_013228 [Brachionus plicatilis]|uniref:Uncharacterized protein n=1 Tax=Brachionus plicatilis TaxID=10195 RepID=A0A3M7RRY5_BRAPC|nr:hypothetical protein BpHYR1_013228 [Brachionus plicatilis]
MLKTINFKDRLIKNDPRKLKYNLRNSKNLYEPMSKSKNEKKTFLNPLIKWHVEVYDQMIKCSIKKLILISKDKLSELKRYLELIINFKMPKNNKFLEYLMNLIIHIFYLYYTNDLTI